MGTTFGAVLSIGAPLLQAYEQRKALAAQGEANVQQARNYITQMNFSFQNLEQERMDAFEQAVSDLEKTKLQGKRLEAQVAAAVNEGLEGGGRTADLLKRAAEADTNRATASIKDNYRKKSNEVDLNKEAALVNAKMSIKSIRDVEAPSLWSTVFNVAASYYNFRRGQDTITAMRNSADVGVRGGGGTPVSAGSGGGVYDQMYRYQNYTTDWSGLFGSSYSQRFNFSPKNPFAAVQTSYFG